VRAAVGRKGGIAGVLCALALLASSSAVPADSARSFLVGVDDDTAKWMGRSDGLVATYRDLGLEGVRVTIPWHHGQDRPSRLAGLYLHRAAMMLANGQRVVLAVYGRPAEAPVDARQRARYCGYLDHIVARIPVKDVVIWNEANSPAFWPLSAGASAYEALLAICWDRLHGRRLDINVISSTAAHHDAAEFIRELGAAYRSSGRSRPIIDTFGHNPYPDYASEPPWATHDDPVTIGEGDLDRLLAALHDAFAGTDQPMPGTSDTTVWYLEDGFQTSVPRSKRRLYHGTETDPSALPAVAPDGEGPDQASQLRDALLLAYCQPAVGAFFNFELIDEGKLGGWQSGLLWRDGVHKPSYDAFKQAVEQVSSGAVDCSTVPGAEASN
jgi:hypothetical protein